MEERLQKQAGFDESTGADKVSEMTSLAVEIERIVTRADPDGSRTSGGRALHKAWSKTVGEQVAAHTQLLHLQGRELLVSVSSPVWATELSLFSEEYKKQFNEILGYQAVAHIRFRVSKRFRKES